MPNTTDTADTVAISFASYGLKEFEGVIGFVHTTENSVVVQEQPTTAVSSSTLTLTVGGSTVSDKKRAFVVFAK